MPNEFQSASAPSQVIGIYHTHRADKLDAGASEDQAHRHAMRMVHNAGWYRGAKGWKQVHGDLREKINIRDPIRQEDGTYVIEDVDVFYPNATKTGFLFDAERIRRLIVNTNKMIDEGSQRPGLIEGHPPMRMDADDTPALYKLELGRQFAPVGYAVNWRENSFKMPGWVKCDLVDVSPEFIERQKSRPLTGLSAGISNDAGQLNERFNHVAVLGSSLQSLSRLPRTELSEVYSSQSVCFASGGSDLTFRSITMTDNEKALHKKMAECYASYSAALASFAAGEPESENKLTEARRRIGEHYSANKAFFDSMPDEPLMKQAAAATSQPSEGPGVLPGESSPIPQGEQKYEGKHNFSADEMDDPRIANLIRERDSAIARAKQQEFLTAGAVGKLVRKNFDSDIADLRKERDLPPDAEIAKQFDVCFASGNPKQALDSLLGMFKAMPKRLTPADAGTVLGAAGATAVPGAAAAGFAQAKRSDRTAAHEKLGVNFSAEDIDLGLKIGDVVAGVYAKPN